MTAEVQLIVGMRGFGKSTLARALCRAQPRVVAFDPMRDFLRHGQFVRCETLHDVRRQLARRWSQGFRLAWPVATNHVEALHGLACLMWEAQRHYEDGAETRPVLIAVDEMNLGYPATTLPANRQGFTRLVLQGRHRGIGLLGITQRPALVSPNFRSNAAATYIFRLEDEDDVLSIRRRLGPAREAMLRGLKQFEYLRYQAGEVAKHKTRKA
jgi:hypothetical protein